MLLRAARRAKSDKPAWTSQAGTAAATESQRDGRSARAETRRCRQRGLMEANGLDRRGSAAASRAESPSGRCIPAMRRERTRPGVAHWTGPAQASVLYMLFPNTETTTTTTSTYVACRKSGLAHHTKDLEPSRSIAPSISVTRKRDVMLRCGLTSSWCVLGPVGIARPSTRLSVLRRAKARWPG